MYVYRVRVLWRAACEHSSEFWGFTKCGYLLWYLSWLLACREGLCTLQSAIDHFTTDDSGKNRRSFWSFVNIFEGGAQISVKRVLFLLMHSNYTQINSVLTVAPTTFSCLSPTSLSHSALWSSAADTDPSYIIFCSRTEMNVPCTEMNAPSSLRPLDDCYRAKSQERPLAGRRNSG